MPNTQVIGRDGEDRACQYLKKQGLKLLLRNFSCKLGEIDLIMQAADHTLVFVEVRARRGRRYGGSLASITHTKQQRLIRAAQVFLNQRCHYQHRACRFDVIAIDANQIDWIRGAFEV